MNSINKPNHRVLILDADFIASLTILRSLSRQGIHCDIASSYSHTISNSSRFVNSHYQYPDPLENASGFVNFICKLLETNEYDLVIPVTERSLIPLSDSSLLDPWRDILAIANKTSLNQVLDKAKTMALAKEIGVCIPFSHPVSSLEEVKSLSNELSYPIVLKPGKSIPDAEHRQQLSVAYAHSASELIHLSNELLPYCQLLIQQYAKGVGTGIELLADHGKVVYAFQHERIHELPLSGGGSCLRKSINIDPTLLKAAKKLIASLHWHGVAMVEFKWQPDTGQYWLMEINGRFWGSLPLAYSAGADFPKMLFDLLVLKQLPNKTNYRKNIFCRKLSADLNWLEQVLRRNEDSRLVTYPSKKQLLYDVALFFNPFQHYYDIQSISDPVPGLIDIYTILKTNSQRLFELLQTKALLKYHASVYLQKRLKHRLNKTNNILFLCYGNINRSALAHALAEQPLKAKKIFSHSAGFHTPDKRPADQNMVTIAMSNNVDLTNCKSTTIDDNLVNQADIILAMEITHLKRLYTEYPNAKGKSYLLGSLSPSQPPTPEIIDPYNKESSIYTEVFKRIKITIDELLINL